MTSIYPTFPASASLVQRCDLVAPQMNKLIEDFDDNKYIGGIEVFQEELLERMRAGGLLTEDEWYVSV